MSDSSEAAVFSASAFLDSVYADPAPARASSRAPTPMLVGSPTFLPPSFLQGEQQECGSTTGDARGAGVSAQLQSTSPKSIRIVSREDSVAPPSPPWFSSRTGWPAGCSGLGQTPSFEGYDASTAKSLLGRCQVRHGKLWPMSPAKHFMMTTASIRTKAITKQYSQLQGESIGPTPAPSRRLHRPSVFPQHPDISSLSVSSDPSCEYAVVISMYEVYNDRIFDLLTPPIKSAATKEYRRRPLLFKSTETSPDRKVVAGLRKVVCGSMHQALMVLEAGLHERRVAGTGSNSVSSRSHGFFCVEVKKRPKGGRRHGVDVPWTGSTLTVVDLAGSERARDAKTAGATLAEAGKINESLMYLGQCLQMQSDAGNKDKVRVPRDSAPWHNANAVQPNLVPFRQCKLTELLFSNCFPSASAYSTARHRNPQKAVMIVTADPHGDFNATSQILRYSALAREVTVPRVPSITQTILTAAAPSSPPLPFSSPVGSPPLHGRPFFPPGATPGSYTQALSPNVERTFAPGSPGSDVHRTTMEVAALEIARLSEELDYLRQALDSERSAREEAESHLLSMEDRMLDLEQAIREDCVTEFERRLEIEMARWRANMQVEMERGEEHWGRKIEVFERSMAAAASNDENMVDEESENKENVLMEDINEENDRLRRDNEILRRELACMSPTKRMPLQERGSDLGLAPRTNAAEPGSPRPGRSAKLNLTLDDGGLNRKLENLRVSDEGSSARNSSGSTSPKKVRKLATKRWEANIADDEDLF